QLHVWDRTRPSGPTVAQGVWDDVRLTGRRELALWLWRVREARRIAEAAARAVSGPGAAATLRAGAAEVAGAIGRAVVPSRRSVGDLLRGDGSFAGTTKAIARRLLRRTGAVLSAMTDQQGRDAAHFLADDRDELAAGQAALSNGRFLTWSYGRGLRLWNKWGEPIGEPLAERITGAVEVEGGRFLAWNFDGAFQLWTLDGVPDGSPIAAHATSVTDVLRLADGRFASVSHDGTLRLWTAAGAPAGDALEGHRDGVLGICQLADGRIVTWGGDRRIILRDDRGRLLRRHLVWDAAILAEEDGVKLVGGSIVIRARFP
ncbi:MAG: WD40 repeat domain-containing protein, partial [Alphaproteobacteria bacterium]